MGTTELTTRKTRRGRPPGKTGSASGKARPETIPRLRAEPVALDGQKALTHLGLVMRFLDSAREFQGLEEMAEAIYNLIREQIPFSALGVLLKGDESRPERHLHLFLNERVGPHFVDQVKKRLVKLCQGLGGAHPDPSHEGSIEMRLSGFFLDRRDRSGVKGFLHIPIHSREAVVGIACLASREPRTFPPEDALLFQLLVGCYGLVLAQVSAVKRLSSLELAGEKLRFELDSEHRQGELTREHHSEIERKNLELTALAQDVQKANEELLEKEARLIQAEKLSAIGRTIAGVAHELNNPLTGILGFAQLLLIKSTEKEKIQRDLDTIVGEANRAKKIVQNLLIFARQQKLTKNFVGVNGIVEGTLDLLARDLKAQSIEVACDLAPELPKTMADFHQMRQVFVNLFTNAGQAMYDAHGGGRLTIRTASLPGPIPGVRSDRVIQVEIRDDGPGIERENLTRIFDPFFTTKKSGKGTGLGLSIAYAIVQEHGGAIFARSEEGQGTTFFLQLPVLAEIPAEAELAPGPARRPVRMAPDLSILVVDDEETIIYMLYDMLTRAGYRVDTAANGVKALVKLEAEDYDLVICDLKMPGMDGRALHQRISALKPEIAKRFVFITGDTANPETISFLHSDGHPHLLKPFSMEELETAIGQAWREASPEERRGRLAD